MLCSPQQLGPVLFGQLTSSDMAGVGPDARDTPSNTHANMQLVCSSSPEVVGVGAEARDAHSNAHSNKHPPLANM